MTTARAPGVAEVDHGLDVVQVAKSDHPGQVCPGQGQPHRIRPRGQDQLVIADLQPTLGQHPAARQVQTGDRATSMQGDPVVAVPGLVIDDDIGEGLLPGQHWREHDAVVVDPRFGPENGYLVAIGIALEHLLDGATARHAVTDNNQSFPAHDRGVLEPDRDGGIAALQGRPDRPPVVLQPHQGDQGQQRQHREAEEAELVATGQLAGEAQA